MVFSFMIMGLNDYKSNIADFTLIFANSKNVVEKIGPFQVQYYKSSICFKVSYLISIFAGLRQSGFV